MTKAQQRAADLGALFAQLPGGQRRVCEKLLDRRSYRYKDVARVLQISLGTVRQHLARVRRRHPAVYRKLMAIRRWQLEERHTRALAREDLRRGVLFGLYEKRLYGHQVGVDLRGLLEATSYYKLNEAEMDDVEKTGMYPPID